MSAEKSAGSPTGQAEGAGDELPDDLQPALAGPYVFPDVRRRLIAAFMYLGLGAVIVVAGFFASQPAYNAGLLFAGLAIVAIGIYTASATWPLRIDEGQAVEAAAAALGFALGPASVSVGWRGLRSRPVWRILAYSHEAPPERRGLVIIDALDGAVISVLEEANPEDWSSDDALGERDEGGDRG